MAKITSRQAAGTGTYQPIDSRSSAGTTWTAGQVVTSGALVYRVDTTHTGAFDTTKATQLGGTSGASAVLWCKTDTQSNVVPTGTLTSFTFGSVTAGGDDLLDLTDPENPTVKTAGLYQVMLSLSVAPGGSPSGGYAVELDLDLNGVDYYETVTGAFADPLVFTTLDRQIVVTAPIPQDGVINATVKQTSGGDRVFYMRSYVIRLGEMPDPS